jgi:hypothetical protein
MSRDMESGNMICWDFSIPAGCQSLCEIRGGAHPSYSPTPGHEPIHSSSASKLWTTPLPALWGDHLLQNEDVKPEEEVEAIPQACVRGISSLRSETRPAEAIRDGARMGGGKGLSIF